MKTHALRILLTFTALATVACAPKGAEATSTPVTAPPTASATAAAPVTTTSPVATVTPGATATPGATSTATPAAQASGTVSQAKELKGTPLNPLPEKQAPKLSKVHRIDVETDAGKLVVEIYPEAAPNASKRFLELVEAGFFDNTAIGRVVKSPEPFVAQFGVNPNMAHWKEKNFDDDPTLFSLEPGTLCFAKAGPNTNSTQVFINLKENNFLASPDMNFTVFGKVVEGMDSVEKFKSVGDPSMGLDQQQLWTNPDYLKSLPEQPTMIASMKVQP